MLKIVFAALLSLVIAGCTQQPPTKSNAGAEMPARLEVHIEPQQPKSGEEAKLVAELRDAKDNAISDAEVKAAAVMKMEGMGDMRESATLKWTGSRYEGAIRPSMAGEWDLTLEATKGGKVIATQKTKVNAQ